MGNSLGFVRMVHLGSLHYSMRVVFILTKFDTGTIKFSSVPQELQSNGNALVTTGELQTPTFVLSYMADLSMHFAAYWKVCCSDKIPDNDQSTVTFAMNKKSNLVASSYMSAMRYHLVFFMQYSPLQSSVDIQLIYIDS
ncbi:hypothetical protein SELMODRAFT_410883 [Selaginella moellendorffii]|uniref:Uncharacterized protein n=1 Tax=Selaginella moellendorffii TaxID=88036 RepID=D8RG64_SELML|nr:hypothetical protein SELMODRAFT_410883 [Selaginella moellendorffii]